MEMAGRKLSGHKGCFVGVPWSRGSLKHPCVLSGEYLLLFTELYQESAFQLAGNWTCQTDQLL